jgi:hypothetical protein
MVVLSSHRAMHNRGLPTTLDHQNHRVAILVAHDERSNDAMPYSDWRSPAAYDHATALETTGFAWECLRRNPDYHRDRNALAYTTPDPIMITTFRRRWGLCFRR